MYTQDLLLQYCKILLDEHRIQLLSLLFAQPQSATQLAEKTHLPLPALLNHLAMLVDAQLVIAPALPNAPYTANGNTILAAKKQLFSIEKAQKKAQLPPDLSDSQRELLLPYYTESILQEVPSKEKPLIALLCYLAEKFQMGEIYPEKEVNQILQVVHPDYALLRRALVDYGFLARANNQYWRLTRD